ncbi:MAG: HlyD family type I secretion periplasmic adaptor subunit [Magnetococcales bacterium]|nr:HlyD family type I secretion periplasmic adaptor subunit [Magnetococcales bacterium]
MSTLEQRRLMLFSFVSTAGILILSFGVWMGVAELDVSSNAMGVVVPSGRVKTVQHLEGGIVRKIHVKEGDKVIRQQPLLSLDPVKASSELEEIATRLQSLEVDMARLTAESQQADSITFPAGVVNEGWMAAARNLFEVRKRKLHHETEALRQVLQQKRQERSEVETRILNSKKLLDIVTSQTTISEKMLDRELTSKMQHLDLKRQEQQLRAQLANDEASRPRIDAAIAETMERLDALRETSLEQVNKELAIARQSWQELSSRAAKFRQVQERTLLTAPTDGIIKNVAVTTEGAVIQPGATVVEIVPQEEGLLIEARLPVHEVGFVHAGQAVRITLNSPDASIFPPLQGVVNSVGPDAQSASREEGSYYRVLISTTAERFSAHGITFDLHPGVQVVCSIRIGKRTVFHYLTGSWLASSRFALEER